MRKLTLLVATTLVVGVGAIAAGATTGGQPRLWVGGSLTGIGANSVTVQVVQATPSARALMSKAVSFTVVANTRITLNHQVVALSSLSSGMPVGVAFVPRSSHPMQGFVAVRVEARTAPAVTAPVVPAPPTRPPVRHEHDRVADQRRQRTGERFHRARRR
jgi:hypothetical protein